MMCLKKRNRAGIVLLSAAGITLLAFSLVWTGLALLRPLEDEAGPYADPAKLRSAGVEYIVVLGGTSFTSEMSASDIWDRSVLRLLEGVSLWKDIPGAKLVYPVAPQVPGR